MNDLRYDRTALQQVADQINNVDSFPVHAFSQNEVGSTKKLIGEITTAMVEDVDGIPTLRVVCSVTNFEALQLGGDIGKGDHFSADILRGEA